MPQAFVIMQIGNTELDSIYDDVIVPSIIANGLEPKRVDRDNEGRLLTSEIVQFINESDILIADLTNERPNCYLEVGYSMGINKFSNLILTCREDHYANSSNYVRGGPRVHFDLAGYDFIFWNPDDIDNFKLELSSKINRRLSLINVDATQPEVNWDIDWLDYHFQKAIFGLHTNGFNAYMEIRFKLIDCNINRNQHELRDAIQESQVRQSGWPIGLYVPSSDNAPHPIANGIFAEIIGRDGRSYDYWTVRNSGDFFLLRSLSEDRDQTQHIYFDTRIKKVTETLLYCHNLYSNMNISAEKEIKIGIYHVGLENRILSSGNPHRHLGSDYQSSEETNYFEFTVKLSDIHDTLIDNVKRIINSLTVIFDFCNIDDGVIEEIVTEFIET